MFIGSLEKASIFCRALEATTKADDVMAFISSLFEEAKLPWNKLVGVCTDGAPAMIGSRSGYITQVKHVEDTIIDKSFFSVILKLAINMPVK